MIDSYCSVSCEASGRFVEKKSVFIGTAAPAETEEEALAFIEKIKKQYPDANHNVSAFINRECNIMRFNDDGEPKGTAGIPVLEVLKRESLCAVAVVVTRYFGGILLGAGGLTRAYARGARVAIEAAGICEYKRQCVYSFESDYSIAQKIEYECSKLNIIVGDKTFGEKVRFLVIASESAANKLDAFLSDLTSGKLKINFEGYKYVKNDC